MQALPKPDEEEVEKVAAETQAALDRVVQGKQAAVNPATLPNQPGGPQYIKYTPSNQNAAHASGAGQRIIKMQDMPVDPLEPPKFRHTKVPRGPGSPPVPVMHSPPRPITQEDQKNWKIPPAISNWKNPKGYTIPLDKRLAADGRGLQQTVINDKFASLSESLFMAESKAREAIQMRSNIQRQLHEKEKAKKEAELRELAMRARNERAGGLASRMDTGVPAAPAAAAGGGGASARVAGGAGRGGEDMSDDEDLPPPPPIHSREPGYQETAEEREERRKRDEIREERRRERERERRLESRDAHPSKKSKLTRDRDRDVSEKVALGMAAVGKTGEVQYDQRLFNQDAGLSSGFGADDEYGVYDRALFADRSAAGGLYRPKKLAPEDEEAGAVRTDKFKPDRGFKGAEVSAGPRSAPVEYERQADAEADPFGLDVFLGEMKQGKTGRNALDTVGGSGHMKAAGGGSNLSDQMQGGSGRRMQFTSGRG
ncbi:GAMYB-binding protein [Dunaliella salina]|uniref:GAMYB-binding protein n=1 Tax=Dunaliella salina TaxID=3046 RepID=A0ABQ7GDQ9_DUNSA|nr:GAMYB-binding protein [Dunaliella salina]|eukprot:KAF5832739.1 GAMYB-binding protein [Dunaliella salina]